MILPSNYDKIDFSKLYEMQKNASSFRQKSIADWDIKACNLNESAPRSSYIDELISKINFTDINSIIDFACGPGVIACKAAKFAKKVFAYDFSPQMLKFAKENALNSGAENVEFKLKSFDDDFSDIPACDIVIASRCLEVFNLKNILEKLFSKAKRRVYMTFKVGGSFVSDDILNILGRDIEQKPDFTYLINILFQMGYLPRLDYIKTPCGSIVDSADELIKKTTWSIGELSEHEKSILKDYFESGEFVPKIESMNWAFFSIDK